MQTTIAIEMLFFIFAENMRVREEYGYEGFDASSRYNTLRTHYNDRRMVRETDLFFY